MADLIPRDRVTFDSNYGLEVVEASPHLMVGRCEVTDKVRQPFGVVHGGAFAAIAEALASIGTNLAVQEHGHVAMGQSNHTNFLRPLREGTIHAEARPRHRGRTSWIWDVDLTDDGGTTCALSRVIIAVRPARPD
ncbi:MAG: PaaI family thioesterase [Candidatus Dormibacteria bacterium]